MLAVPQFDVINSYIYCILCTRVFFPHVRHILWGAPSMRAARTSTTTPRSIFEFADSGVKALWQPVPSALWQRRSRRAKCCEGFGKNGKISTCIYIYTISIEFGIPKWLLFIPWVLMPFETVFGNLCCFLYFFVALRSAMELEELQSAPRGGK